MTGMRFLRTFGTGLLSRSEKVGLAGGGLLPAAAPAQCENETQTRLSCFEVLAC